MSATGDAGDLALKRIEAAGGTRIAPPTLVPARTILDLSGEAVRSRLCAFTDAGGEEFALRPDMTTPIAVMAASGEVTFRRYHYSGSVYRLAQPGSGDPIEFRQVGFEWFGDGGAREDAEALATAIHAVAEAGGAGGDAALRVGDVGLYHAVVDALPLSRRWKERLKRAFSRRKGPRRLVEEASAGGREGSALGESLSAMSPEQATQAVEEIFAISGVRVTGGRSAAEIAERLRDIASDEAPPAVAVASLLDYLDLEGPVQTIVERVRRFADRAGIDIAQAVDRFETRLREIEALSPPWWDECRFSAEAGQRFEYYDGFVFDLTPADQPERPAAAGGRYDGLIAKLSGGARHSAAIGAALRVSRLSNASGVEARAGR